MLRTVVLCLVLATGGAHAQPTPTTSQGVVVVESEPARAFVLIDSARIGSTPVGVAVESGLRRVRVVYSGYDPFEQTVRVRAGETSRVTATLVRRTGAVSVEGLPDGATVTLDGATVDGPVAVPTGDARIRVEVPGQRAVEAVVVVESGAETRLVYSPRSFDASAFSLALLTPGGAQILGHRPLVGAAFAAGVGACIGAAFAARAAEREIDREVEAAHAVYRAAGTEAAAVDARAEVDRLFGEARGARRYQHAALAAAAAIYGASVVDAFLRHAFRPGLRATLVRLPPRAEIGAGGAGVRLALTF